MTIVSTGLPRLNAGLADFAEDYDLVLCDVWGVVHNGVAHHTDAVEALQTFRAAGGTVVLITNAPAPRAQVQARLGRLCVPRAAYDDIATSGDVTSDLIVAAGCPPVFNIGPVGETAIYDEAARKSGVTPRLVAPDIAQMAICIGLDETGERPEDYDEVLSRLRARDLDLVCANPDIVVEVGDELVFCAGAVAERYEAIGGHVIQAGKPFPAIYERALDMARAVREREVPSDRVLAIGDALHTDIKGARERGFASILITAGIHRETFHDAASRIDARALGRALEEHRLAPVAAMPRLRW